MTRQRKQKLFHGLCFFMTTLTVVILAVLLTHVVMEGIEWISFEFLDRFPSRKPHKAGIKSALFGTLWVISLTAFFAVPIGVATAVYLQEYAPKNRIMEWVRINIANLAGMPSIIYGLLGLAIFVRFFGFERSILSGSLTLALLIVPIIIIASEGALKSVPNSLREAAYAMGARKWQVVIFQVLPSALPGIMTGIILAISRSVGETAPLIITGALGYVAFTPESISDPYTVLPVQIYNWAARPQVEFHGLAAAGIVVLLTVLLSMNLLAVIIRNKSQKTRTS